MSRVKLTANTTKVSQAARAFASEGLGLVSADLLVFFESTHKEQLKNNAVINKTDNNSTMLKKYLAVF